MNTEELKKLIDELVKLGEDREELSTIAHFFPTLDEEGQKAMVESLKKELEALKKL